MAKAKYSYKLEDDEYVIYKNEKILKTPEGKNVVKTKYKDLAERIVNDLEEYGGDYRSVTSILAWHYTLIDRLEPMGREYFKTRMEDSFLSNMDWTVESDYNDFYGYAIDWDERKDFIMKWLSKITPMQMVAACCIGNAYESLNLAFLFALFLEKYKGSNRDDEFLRTFSRFPIETFCGSYDDFVRDFNTFALYYGFHLKENGPVIKKIVKDKIKFYR